MEKQETTTEEPSCLGSTVAPCYAKISGFVRYSLNVTCPHCNGRLDLNQWPYDDDQEDYASAEDELGLALFGRTDEPAKWKGIEIKYKCYHCKDFFLLTEIEI